MERRLAAILAADVVGYSRLMEKDEAGTLAALNAHMDELIGPTIAEHNGRIVRLIGDGALVEFASVVDALKCASTIQRAMVERNALLPEDRRIAYRIGINIGDIIVEGREIHGDGVNVAARLEALADPGGICVSRNVFNQAKNKLFLTFEDLGDHRVKNISEPVRVYRVHVLPAAAPRRSRAERRRRRRAALVAAATVAVALAGLAAWDFLAGRWPLSEQATAGATPGLAVVRGPSIAVLPFVNISNDPRQEVFSDGITEEIITALSRFRDLHVLARSTIFQHKGMAVDIRRLGRDLEVRYVVEGSVRRAGDIVRVAAQLIDAETGMHLWAETFERQVTVSNIFAVQDDIAAKVAASVAASHGGAISNALLRASAAKPPEQLTSYECVLQAFGIWRRLSDALVLRSRDCLEIAVERDPYYADAWALLSQVYAQQRWFGWGLPEAEATELSKRAHLARLAVQVAQRAVAIAPDSAIARSSLAQAYWCAGELDRFRAEAKQSLGLNPNDPVVLGPLGSDLAFAGWWDEGLPLVRKAVALAPKSHGKWWLWAIAKDHYRKGDYEAAAKVFEETVVPGLWLSQLQLAYSYGMLGDDARGAEALSGLQALKPGFSIDDALAFHRLWNFRQAYLDRMAEGLRRAGLPKAGSGAEESGAQR